MMRLRVPTRVTLRQLQAEQNHYDSLPRITSDILKKCSFLLSRLKKVLKKKHDFGLFIEYDAA